MTTKSNLKIQTFDARRTLFRWLSYHKIEFSDTLFSGLRAISLTIYRQAQTAQALLPE
jgi:hypothetical protein